MGEVKTCPNCGKPSVREATSEEKSDYKRKNAKPIDSE
jgi:endogenous inhibitor of DNA gyrase (YacG/DUF329 family)